MKQSKHVYRKTTKMVDFNVNNAQFGDRFKNGDSKGVNLIIIKQYIFVRFKPYKISSFVEQLHHISFKTK